MTQEEPRLLVVPLLNEEQMKLFLHLAMEMAAIVKGDKWEKQSKPDEEGESTLDSSYRIA